MILRGNFGGLLIFSANYLEPHIEITPTKKNTPIYVRRRKRSIVKPCQPAMCAPHMHAALDLSKDTIQ